ncbi:hypothetical protein B566_EDAN003648 [Ephemera danica]|nr:hypothetical protein B566_EDAN003648 [Ephemera danica]
MSRLNILKFFCFVCLHFTIICWAQHPDYFSDNGYVDCRLFRLQQYFCISRCISFVRDESPSTLMNYTVNC